MTQPTIEQQIAFLDKFLEDSELPKTYAWFPEIRATLSDYIELKQRYIRLLTMLGQSDFAAHEAERKLATLSAASAVPDGFILWPKELTPKMVAVGLHYLRNDSPTNLWAAIDAMKEVAPAPQPTVSAQNNSIVPRTLGADTSERIKTEDSTHALEAPLGARNKHEEVTPQMEPIMPSKNAEELAESIIDCCKQYKINSVGENNAAKIIQSALTAEEAKGRRAGLEEATNLFFSTDMPIDFKGRRAICALIDKEVGE